MNRKMKCTGALWALALCLGGCEYDSRVERETEDLKEAQQNSPKVAAKLERELAEAKAEVARLEEKLTLARQGITDDVQEERKELKGALNAQSREVKEEIGEAQRAAREHSAESNVAEQQLERTKPTEQVKAEVHTDVERTPVRGEVEVHEEQTTLTVPETEVKERTERTEERPIDQALIEKKRAEQRDRATDIER